MGWPHSRPIGNVAVGTKSRSGPPPTLVAKWTSLSARTRLGACHVMSSPTRLANTAGAGQDTPLQPATQSDPGLDTGSATNPAHLATDPVKTLA